MDMEAVWRVRRKTRNVYKHGSRTTNWLETKTTISTINNQGLIDWAYGNSECETAGSHIPKSNG